jgi:hypothetical protein
MKVFCFLLLLDTKKTMFYDLQLRPKLDYTFKLNLVASFQK